MKAVMMESRVCGVLGEDATLLGFTHWIFRQLQCRYRADYIYRAAIANKLFLGRHSPSTTTLLSELRVWRSRADIVMLNGTSTVYEIKTEIDNFDRVESQISAYSQMFDKIYVVTCESKVEHLLSTLPQHVGVIVLSNAFSFQFAKEAESNADNVSVPVIVDSLRLDELLKMTVNVCGITPQASRVKLVEECGKLLSNHDPRVVHDEMVDLLKKRANFNRSDFSAVPSELVPAYLDSGVKASQWPSLTKRLSETTIKEVLDS